MDGGGRVLAAPVPVLLGGKYVLVHPLTIGGICSAENWILLQRNNPADVIADTLSNRSLTPAESVAWKAMLDKAVADMRANKELCIVTLAQFQEWIYQPGGMAFTAWWCCGRGRDADERFTDPGKAGRFFREDTEGSDSRLFRRARDLVSGLDLLSSLDWPERMKHPVTGKEIPVLRENKYINWQEMLQQFAEGFGWSHEQVAQLTLYQSKLYASEKGSWGRHGGGSGGSGSDKVDITPEDAQKMRGMNKQEKRRFLQSLRLRPVVE